MIWGQSAGESRQAYHTACIALTRRHPGASLVGSYIYAHGEDPIVSGAIAMSGAAANLTPDNSSSFTALAEAADCGGLSAEDELACMQNVPALRLQDLVQGATLPGSNTTTPRFNAVIDGVTVFTNNTERLEKNLTATIVRQSVRHPSMTLD